MGRIRFGFDRFIGLPEQILALAVEVHQLGLAEGCGLNRDGRCEHRQQSDADQRQPCRSGAGAMP
jgi:hypothetical protein